MIVKLFFHAAAGFLGLLLATRFVSGVNFYGTYQTLLIIGAVLGLINFFIRPVIYKITLPLRVLTFGLFSLIINMFLIWLIDIIFPKEMEIKGLIPLFWTTIIVWATNFFFGLYLNKKNKP